MGYFNKFPPLLTKPFPVVRASASGTKPASNTTVPVSMPVGHVAGDILVMVVSGSGGPVQTVNTPAGWTLATPETGPAGSALRWLAIFWKVSTGTETTVNVISTGANFASWGSFAISGASSLECSPLASSTSGAPDCPSFSPSWGHDSNLWIAVAAQYSLTAAQANLSGWTDFNQVVRSDGSDHPRTMWCFKSEKVETQNPPPYPASISGASVGWAAATIAIKP